MRHDRKCTCLICRVDIEETDTQSNLAKWARLVLLGHEPGPASAIVRSDRADAVIADASDPRRAS